VKKGEANVGVRYAGPGRLGRVQQRVGGRRVLWAAPGGDVEACVAVVAELSGSLGGEKTVLRGVGVRTKVAIKKRVRTRKVRAVGGADNVHLR
jgi:hypothetical protein